MEKAYDPSYLVAKLKARGVDVAEAAAKGVFEDVVSFIEESAKLSATPFDDLVVGVLQPFKPLALAEIDKLNGKVGA